MDRDINSKHMTVGCQMDSLAELSVMVVVQIKNQKYMAMTVLL